MASGSDPSFARSAHSRRPFSRCTPANNLAKQVLYRVRLVSCACRGIAAAGPVNADEVHSFLYAGIPPFTDVRARLSHTQEFEGAHLQSQSPSEHWFEHNIRNLISHHKTTISCLSIAVTATATASGNGGPRLKPNIPRPAIQHVP